MFYGEEISVIKDDILEALHNFGFQAEFVNTDQRLEHLSGQIQKWASEPQSRPQDLWYKTGEAATCDLIVTGQVIHKHDKRRVLFAVTSAHLLLGEDITRRLVSITNHRKSNKFLNTQRKKVNSKINRNTYRLLLSKHELENRDHENQDDNTYVDLTNPPMFCYHYYRYKRHQQNCQQQQPFKLFRNDIALLPIELSDSNIVGDHGQLRYLTKVTPEFIEEITRCGERVFVKGKRGNVVQVLQSAHQDRVFGLNLAFILDEK